MLERERPGHLTTCPLFLLHMESDNQLVLISARRPDCDEIGVNCQARSPSALTAAKSVNMGISVWRTAIFGNLVTPERK
jgi:hypothetical protein